MSALATRQTSGDSLADLLERVLDKGIVIAGDIQINLLDIELLTIKLRLVVASIDKAKEMGIDWWESDPALNGASSRLAAENARLRERLDRVEGLLTAPQRDAEPVAPPVAHHRAARRKRRGP
jgi:Gas vesicle protein